MVYVVHKNTEEEIEGYAMKTPTDGQKRLGTVNSAEIGIVSNAIHQSI